MVQGMRRRGGAGPCAPEGQEHFFNQRIRLSAAGLPVLGCYRAKDNMVFFQK
jgi:hypothetical protein